MAGTIPITRPAAGLGVTDTPASSSSEPELTEVVVTATRTAENAQNVPISLTPLTAEELEKQGITTKGELGELAAGLYVMDNPTMPMYTLRGLTQTDLFPSGQASIATVIDDVFQVFNWGQGDSLFDLGRIEVLRGPQGTTFGKNTTGGAVAYYSQVPTDQQEGYVSARLSGGEQSQRYIEGAENIPLIQSTLAMRVSVRAEDFGDYARNITSGGDVGDYSSLSGRVQLRWTPSAETTVNLKLEHMSQRGDPVPYSVTIQNPCLSLLAAYICPNGVVAPRSPPLSADVIASPAVPNYENISGEGATLLADQQLASWTLTSISHFRRATWDLAQSVDGLSADYAHEVNATEGRQFGQEFRLASDQTQKLRGLVGLFYLNDRNNYDYSNGATLAGPGLDYNSRDATVTAGRSYAAFSSATIDLVKELSFTAGVRKTVDQRNQSNYVLNWFPGDSYNWTNSNFFFPINAPPFPPDQVLSAPAAVKDAPVTWDGTLSYRPADNTLLFVRIAKGFRGGGFGNVESIYPTYKPEQVLAYEIGTKLDLLEKTLRVNASAYHYNYTDQQIPTAIYNNEGVPDFVVTNAGKSVINGLELETTWLPVKALEFSFNSAYTDAHFTNYLYGNVNALGLLTYVQYAGNELLQSPKLMANAGVSYIVPVNTKYQLRLNTLWSYRSAVYFTPDNLPIDSDPARTTGNVRFGLEPVGERGGSITAFVDNVTDQRAKTSAFAWDPTPGVNWNTYTYSRGIRFGVDLGYKW